VRNVGIDVLCRFPRSAGREGNGFMFSSLSIRPSFRGHLKKGKFMYAKGVRG
jgi:hypothetical protein